MQLGFVAFEGVGYETAVRQADELGFDFVELMVPYVAKGEPELGREYLAERADDVKAVLADHDVDLVVHLPHGIDVGAPSDILREAAVEEVKENVRVAADLGAEKGVIHPTAFARERVWTDGDVRDRILQSIAELDDFARGQGFELCMENIRGTRFTVHDFDRFFAETACSMTLDTGHARVSGMADSEIAAFVADHHDRIGHVHVNDNKAFLAGENGTPTDDHVPTGSGDMDLETVLEPFAGAGWEGTFSLEIQTRDFEYIELGKRQFERAYDAVSG